jgi:sodium-dependent phosphate cotransporter
MVNTELKGVKDTQLAVDEEADELIEIMLSGGEQNEGEEERSEQSAVTAHSRGDGRISFTPAQSARPLTPPPMSKPSSRIGRIYRKTSKDIRPMDRTDLSLSTKGASRLAIHPYNSEKEKEKDHRDEMDDEREAATWKEVFNACCCHTYVEWFYISIGVLLLCFFLYFFLLGLELLGQSFKVVGGCTAGSLLGDDTNPLGAVMIGILATALLQSSSTTTAIIVSLVSGGLDVHQGIYMVMGANVGTSVTCIIVSLAHMGDATELERAFAGSSVLWAFHFLSLIVLFPIEVASEYLYRLTKAMLPSPSEVDEGEKWEGPIKKIVSPLGNRILKANSELIEGISTGDIDGCSDRYPVQCLYDTESYDSCPDTVTGLIGCDEKTNKCPAFFENGASKNDDTVSGWVCLVVALVLLILCLIGLVALLRKMLLGASTRILYKATNVNHYLGIAIGCGVTVLVQSSSITSSVLVPLAALGILKLEQIYPLVLGAAIGTTFTALMAAMVSSKVESLQIALVHLFFNITGAVLFYPVPIMRRIPLCCARKLGKVTRSWRNFPILFIVVMFILLPIFLLGISACFEQHTTGFTALGTFLLVLLGVGILYFWYWWRCKNGKRKCRKCIIRRQRRKAAIKQLADDMDYLKCDIEYAKNEIGRLKDFAGIATRPEEGRPPPSLVTAEMWEGEGEEEEEPEEDQVSLYQSCQSKPWQDILLGAAGSVRSALP